jgi:hypothetical protein
MSAFGQPECGLGKTRLLAGSRGVIGALIERSEASRSHSLF